jgi:hypothetical protein
MILKRSDRNSVSFQAKAISVVAVLSMVAVAAAVMALLPVRALGAQATLGASGWSYIDIGAEYDQPTTFILVGGELATDTPLPRAVRIAVPASSTPTWVGQVFSSNSASDTQLPYKVTRSGTMDIYSMTLTASNLGQVEALVPGLITPSGSDYVVAMNWVAPEPVPTCRIAVSLPANAQIVKAGTGAQLDINVDGTKHYYRLVSDVKAGDTISLAFTYTLATSSGGRSSSSIPVVWWIVAIGVVVAIVLLVLVLRQNARASRET